MSDQRRTGLVGLALGISLAYFCLPRLAVIAVRDEKGALIGTKPTFHNEYVSPLGLSLSAVLILAGGSLIVMRPTSRPRGPW